MRHGIGRAIAPGRKIAAHQVGVGRVTDHVRDMVVRDQQPHGVRQVALEGQVDIAAVQHQGAVDAARSRERQRKPARPMGERAGLGREAPDAAHPRPGQIRAQVGARLRVHLHPARGLQTSHGVARHGFVLSLRQAALENFRVLVADHEHARPAGQDPWQLGRMLKALDGAVDHQRALRQGRHDRRLSGEHRRGAGRTHRHRCRQRRRRHDDLEVLCANSLQGQCRQLRQHRPRPRLGEHRAGIARAYTALLQDLDECSDPRAFNGRGHHMISPSRW